jgi:hypothetical protein
MVIAIACVYMGEAQHAMVKKERRRWMIANEKPTTLEWKRKNQTGKTVMSGVRAAKSPR